MSTSIFVILGLIQNLSLVKNGIQISEQKLPLLPKTKMLKKLGELKRGSGRFQDEPKVQEKKVQNSLNS